MANIKSYAQLGADLVASFHLGKTKNVTYIDIGCLWPIDQSSTYLFYENGGHGLCIDPNPHVADIYRKQRPRDAFFNYGVGVENIPMQYYMYKNAVYNTFSEDSAKVMRKRWKNGARPKFELLGTREVEVRPLGDIVRASEFDARDFDFLSIDTEGFEEKILNSIDFTDISPRLICFEKKIQDDPETFNIYKDDIVEFMDSKGYYVVAFTGHDVFMKRRL